MKQNAASLWFDDQGDFIEVLWSFREGYFVPSEDERVLKRLDDDGQVIGFLIHDVGSFKGSGPLEIDLSPEPGNDKVEELSVRQAAHVLGVSERRVRRLARDGRVRGAAKSHGRWTIPTPVQLKPGTSGPAGIAGRPARNPT